MLTKRNIEKLHQIAQQLETDTDFRRAVATITKHNSTARLKQLEQRRQQINEYANLHEADKIMHRERNKAKSLKYRSKLREFQKELKDTYDTFQFELISIVKDQNLRPLFFHYYGDESSNFRLFATTCLLLDSGTVVTAKGIALASFLDHPNKLEGRVKSLNRAIEAKLTELTSEPIKRTEAAEIIQLIRMSNEPAWSNKTIYQPNLNELTELERNRLERIRKRTQSA